jgi:hypothetical protein
MSQRFRVSEPDENGLRWIKRLFLIMGSYGRTVPRQFVLVHLLVNLESFTQL